MPNRRKPTLDLHTLPETLRTGIESYCLDQSHAQVGIEAFIRNYLDLGIAPSQQQITLLKAFYQEPLTEQEQSILEYWRSEGRTNWQEGERYQYLVLEAGRRSGKCLAKETLVATGKGWLKLEEIAPPGAPDSRQPLDLTVHSEAGPVQATAFYTYGASDTVRVTTALGYQIAGRPEHRVRNENGEWVRLDRLRAGDKVRIYPAPAFGEEEIEPNAAQLLGLLCNQRFNDKEKEVRVELRKRDMEAFRRLMTRIGYIKTTNYPCLNDRHKRHLLFCEPSLRRQLHEMGLAYTPIDQTEVPLLVRTGTRKTQIHFLIGLFDYNDGEGYTLIHPSRTLLAQVQCLLLGLGIRASLTPYHKPKQRGPLYKLEVIDLRLAKKLLPLETPTKQLQTSDLPPRASQVPEFWTDEIQSIEAGQALCADLHIPGPECYIAAGFSSHNTNICAAVIGAYEFFKLVRLKNPQVHYGIAKSTPISIICLATQATQGERTIFAGVKGLLEDSPYFQRLIRQGELLLLEGEVRMPSKRLAIYAGNSKSGSQVGGTVKALIMDEVARFENDKGIANAIELWNNLGAATVTFGTEAVKVAVSSAWCEGDAIQILREEGRFAPHTLTFSLRSWDLNPEKASRDNPVIAAAYAGNPVLAALEYENIRPPVGQGFIPVGEVQGAPKQRASIRLRPSTRVIGTQTYQTVACEEVEPRVEPCVIHLDPSLGRDGYALAIGHLEWDDDAKVVVIDGLALWQSTANQPIYLPDVERVIRDIYQHRPVALVSADHHGAGAETLQRLRGLGLRTEVVYFSNRQQLAMYELVRQLLHLKRLVLPGDSPWYGDLVKELSRLQLVRNTRIDHPPGAGESKDLADAVAGAVWQLHQLTYLQPGNRTPRPTAVVNLDERRLHRQEYLQYRSSYERVRPR